METGMKLKLMRALTGLTQQEMADLMGVSRSFIISIEDREKKMPIQRARILADILNIEEGWLIDNRYNFINGSRLALFCFDGNKAMGSTAATQKRSINASSKFVTRYLPEIFADTNVTYRYICRVDSENALFLVVFDSQGLLLKITDCGVMVGTLDCIVRGLEGKTVQEGTCSLDIVRSIDYSAPDILNAFIDDQNLSPTEKKNFKKSIDGYRDVQEYLATVSVNGRPRKTLQEVARGYGLRQQKARVKRVCQDIMVNNIRLDDIKEILVKNGRNDLILTTSQFQNKKKGHANA